MSDSCFCLTFLRYASAIYKFLKYIAVSGVVQFSVCGVFVDDKANGGWFLLGSDASLDVWHGF